MQANEVVKVFKRSNKIVYYELRLIYVFTDLIHFNITLLHTLYILLLPSKIRASDLGQKKMQHRL